MPPGDTPVTADQGWNRFTRTLAYAVPRALQQSSRSRSGLRRLMRSRRWK